MQNDSHTIPTRLDDKPKFLFFDYDVAIVALMPCVIGISISQFFGLVGLFVGCILAVGYKSFKSGKHAGVLTHLIFWKTGTPTPSSMPKSHQRNFLG